jgi:hypothetical protein
MTAVDALMIASGYPGMRSHACGRANQTMVLVSRKHLGLVPSGRVQLAEGRYHQERQWYRPQRTVIDSHCHIDMPEDALKPIKRPDSAGGSVWFDAGLTVRWVWEHLVSSANVNFF